MKKKYIVTLTPEERRMLQEMLSRGKRNRGTASILFGTGFAVEWSWWKADRGYR